MNLAIKNNIMNYKNHGLRKGDSYIINTGFDKFYYVVKRVIDKDNLEFATMNIFQISRYKLKSLAMRLKWKANRLYCVIKLNIKLKRQS